LSRLRLPLVICVCCLFWAGLGALLGALSHHALLGLILGLLFGIGYVVFGSWAAEKFPLDVWDANLLESIHAPKLYEMIKALCERVDMETPILYYSTRPEPNAYAMERRESDPVIVVTSGLTRHLDKDEVQAVMALMIARLASGVMPSWTVTSTLAGLPLQIGLGLHRRGQEGLGNALLMTFAHPAAALARLGWDAKVVTAADHHAAHLAEQPGALMSALIKIEAGQGEDLAWAGNPATAMLFAAPPLPITLADATPWRRALAAFPSRRPDVAARMARLSSSAASPPAQPPSQPAGDITR